MTNTTDPKSGTCRCGCGEATAKHYRPGHDARHVGQLKRAVVAGTIEKRAALRALPTEPLREKLSRSIGKQPRKPEAVNN